MQSWNDFKEVFADTVLPIYERHELTFDFVGIHGRKYLTRSIILAEAMSQFYRSNLKVEVDDFAVRMAISFHDSEREGNGPDMWERESRNNCYQYLMDQGIEKQESEIIANYILDKKSDVVDLVGQIIYDADVLEILRLYDLSAFRESEFLFLSSDDILYDQLLEDAAFIRDDFIREAFLFIRDVDDDGFGFYVNDEYLDACLKHVFAYRDTFVTLNQYLKHLE